MQVLSPKFISSLPNDVITGEPFKYERAAGGQFILSSVGWNEKDDGGAGKGLLDRLFTYKDGDWVWSYPHEAGPNPAATSAGL